MAFMDRNNLTAILAALAIVPLYFKEPSQPAPEKWERGALTSEIDLERGQMLVFAPGVYARAERDPDGQWTLHCHPALDNPKADLRDGVKTSLWGAQGFISATRTQAEQWMVEGGWQPFAVERQGDSSWILVPTIHYRRRVQ